MKKILILAVVAITAQAWAAPNIFEAKSFALTQKVGKNKYEISITANADQTFTFVAKKDGKEVMNKKDQVGGKGGDDGNGLIQFDIASEYIGINRVSILQNAKGAYSYDIGYEVSVAGKKVTVK